MSWTGPAALVAGVVVWLASFWPLASWMSARALSERRLGPPEERT